MKTLTHELSQSSCEGSRQRSFSWDSLSRGKLSCTSHQEWLLSLVHRQHQGQIKGHRFLSSSSSSFFFLTSKNASYNCDHKPNKITHRDTVIQKSGNSDDYGNKLSYSPPTYTHKHHKLGENDDNCSAPDIQTPAVPPGHIFTRNRRRQQLWQHVQ